VRLGIAKALNSTIMGRARFNGNWTIEDPQELERLLDEIIDCLASPRFGLFYAFSRVFGREVAITIGNKGQFVVPPGVEVDD